ncbi:MAG: hypothetical protein Q8Q49_02295 [bacterium]|nr:hypothetical protein [bacterium]
MKEIVQFVKAHHEVRRLFIPVSRRIPSHRVLVWLLGKNQRNFDPDEVGRELAPFLPEKRPSRQTLEEYRTQEWYFHNPKQIHANRHGTGHHGRDLVLAGLDMGKLEESEGIRVNEDVVYRATSVHDTQREDDIELLRGQVSHAERGAQFVRDSWRHFDPEMTQETLEGICYLVGRHSDRREPRESPWKNEMGVMLRADWLDLTRGMGFEIEVGQNEVAERLLEISERASGRVAAELARHHVKPYPWALDLVSAARALSIESRRDRYAYQKDQFGASLNAAERLGLLVP